MYIAKFGDICSIKVLQGVSYSSLKEINDQVAKFSTPCTSISQTEGCLLAVLNTAQSLYETAKKNLFDAGFEVIFEYQSPYHKNEICQLFARRVRQTEEYLDELKHKALNPHPRIAREREVNTCGTAEKPLP